MEKKKQNKTKQMEWNEKYHKKKEYYFIKLWCQWYMYMCVIKGYIKCYFSHIEKN